MKIKRKGNPKGIDIDHEVTNVTTEEADELHKSLLKKGLVFTYSSDGVYEPPTKNIILHYIDKDLNMYDYAILFTKQEKSVKQIKEQKSDLDIAYERASHDPDFKDKLATYMRYHVLLRIFSRCIGTYGSLKGKHLQLFKKMLRELKGIPLPTEYTQETLKQLSKDLFKLILA